MTPESEKQLNELLRVAGVPRRASFLPSEVKKILGVSLRQVQRMCAEFEPGPGGRPIKPFTLDSFTLGNQRRVRYAELADFLDRNRTYERLHGEDPGDEVVEKARARHARKMARRAGQKKQAPKGGPVQVGLWE